MNPSLPALIARLHAFSGIAHKRDIQQVARELRDAWPNPSPNGDDCALIPDGSGYKLLAIEGFINRFVAEGHCCKVSDEAAFCLIQRPYISKTLLTRRISPRGSP